MRDKKACSRYAILAGVALTLCLSDTSVAQEHINNSAEHTWLRLAEEQYRQGNYALAAQAAQKYLGLYPKIVYNNSYDAGATAKYYQTLSQLRLKVNGAEDSAINYLVGSTNPAYKQRTSFALGQYYFENRQYASAIRYFEAVKLNNLSNEDVADLKFQLGYSYFNEKQLDKAAPLFNAVQGLGGKYTHAGNYYNGLLAYNAGKYDEAMASFRKIDQDPVYKAFVPFYEAEILYFTGKNEEALEKTLSLIKNTEKSYYDNELHLLAAQLFFEKQRYNEAIPYFEHYYDNVEQIRKEELYEMAYSYYQTQQWEKAIDKFKPLSSSEDSLGQTAMYLLGDSYLKTGDKPNARNAFGIASDLSFDRMQQETSLLMYAKLSYETGRYDEAMNSLSSLFKNYPGSRYENESRTIFSDLLLKTNNYEDAWKALQQVNERNDNYWNVYQKVAYGYAMQQLQTGNTAEADRLLSLSLQQPANSDYEAAANFWKGELAYQNARYREAYDYSKKVVDKGISGASYLSSQATLSNAYLNLGYAAMELNEYANAQAYFSKAQQGVTTNNAFTTTASLREADAFFMQKNFKQAEAIYDKVISSGYSSDADYARLQKAVIAGINNQTDQKIKLLHVVTSKIPASAYAPNARYELGLTYIEDDKYKLALEAFQPLLSAQTGKDFSVKAWMKSAFAYQQLNQDEKAIDAYKHIVLNYPGSEEKEDALAALRNLYIENSNPDAYAALLKENNIGENTDQALDSTYYAAAESQIAASKWKEAKTSLSSYIEKYPNGSFTTRAHYYLGESNYQLKEYDAALKEYDEVLRLPWNEFSENSARNAAVIAFNKKDYAKAEAYYQQLRVSALSKENLQSAYSGLMRASYNAKNYDQAAKYADTLLSLPDVDVKLQDEVQFYKAKALQQQGKNDEALGIYSQLKTTKNTDISDEAKYRTAEIQFAKGNLKEAETQAAENLKANNGNNYWVVKSYILLSDIFAKQKDYFNAKATLQSVIKNAKYEDLKQEAVGKLNEVKKLEKEQTKLSGE
ncbi:MAG TPA: tetratricopeptide repeat protein [Flavipsychrobacter sp.]|nr:tetratricopeptide repeat protein [Flavipsychrobacter sp.]